jgi:hypothetical protein
VGQARRHDWKLEVRAASWVMLFNGIENPCCGFILQQGFLVDKRAFLSIFELYFLNIRFFITNHRKEGLRFN